jgi:ribonucrease Y
MWWVIIGLALAIFGTAGGAYYGASILGPRRARKEAERIEQEARTNSEHKLEIAHAEAKRIVTDAKDQAQEVIQEAQREAKNRDREIKNKEKALYRQEERVQRNQDRLDKKLSQVEKTLETAEERERAAEAKVLEIDERLMQVAALTQDEAREIVLTRARDESEHEIARLVRDIEEEAKQNASVKSRHILVEAMQRTTVDHYSEAIISTVELKNDDMKGRIIGREGRNIRAIEAATGVDVIIDDTPGVVVLSCFDPIRREMARRSLEMLIADGRIHPAKIEEIVEKVTQELDELIWEAGQEACFQTGITGLNPELVKLLGKLKYRTSYGQNVLKHAVEVAHLAGVIAAEIGIKVKNAKRGGLLHDIGKAVIAEMEGSHPEVGMELARKYGENAVVCNVIGAHHGDLEQSIEAALVQVADALSASRPGARGEALQSYIQRLTKLEDIAVKFAGVDKVYAIQAGRELRVLVKPEIVDDVLSWDLCRKIARQIEKELEYPGMIKVTLIREVREIDFAR